MHVAWLDLAKDLPIATVWSLGRFRPTVFNSFPSDKRSGWLEPQPEWTMTFSVALFYYLEPKRKGLCISVIRALTRWLPWTCFLSWILASGSRQRLTIWLICPTISLPPFQINTPNGMVLISLTRWLPWTCFLGLILDSRARERLTVLDCSSDFSDHLITVLFKIPPKMMIISVSRSRSLACRRPIGILSEGSPTKTQWKVAAYTTDSLIDIEKCRKIWSGVWDRRPAQDHLVSLEKVLTGRAYILS